MTEKADAKPAALSREVNRTRLEFLFDGIFAIAMTILVLELKVPELADRHSTRELFSALAHSGPTFCSYVLSFTMLGIFWYNHQFQYRFVRKIGKAIFAANLVMMATAGAFPFCVALLGHYPTNPGVQLLYMACPFLHSVASTAQWLIATRQNALDPALDAAGIRRLRNRNLRSTCSIAILVLAYGFVVIVGR